MSLEPSDLIKRQGCWCGGCVLFLLISIAFCVLLRRSSLFCVAGAADPFAIICWFADNVAARSIYGEARSALVFSTRDWHSNPIKLAHNNNDHESWREREEDSALQQRGGERSIRRIPSTRPNCVLSTAANI